MKPIDLQLIGVPERYRHLNPFQLTPELRLDAFPSRGEPSAVTIWMKIEGDKQALPHLAWFDLLEGFVTVCESNGIVPFTLPTDRRNHDEHVRSFLQIRRRRIRDYLDPLEIVALRPYKAERTYTRFENSWWLLSELKMRTTQPESLAIARRLVLDKRWIKTLNSHHNHRGTVTWHKWIQWGVSRVGWSAGAGFSWLWYEIRCPELPGASGYYRDQTQEQFNEHVDDLWLPLVHSIRWWSTSNPRTWNF